MQLIESQSIIVIQLGVRPGTDVDRGAGLGVSEPVLRALEDRDRGVPVGVPMAIPDDRRGLGEGLPSEGIIEQTHQDSVRGGRSHEACGAGRRQLALEELAGLVVLGLDAQREAHRHGVLHLAFVRAADPDRRLEDRLVLGDVGVVLPGLVVAHIAGDLIALSSAELVKQDGFARREIRFRVLEAWRHEANSPSPPAIGSNAKSPSTAHPFLAYMAPSTYSIHDGYAD